MKRILSLILAFVTLILSTSCTKALKKEYSFFGMDTLMTVTVFDSGALSADEIAEKTEALSKELETVFSATNENAEVYRFNSRDGDSFAVSSTLKSALLKAQAAYDITEGAFDITVMPLLTLWGFQDGSYRLPRDSEIKSALKYANGSALTLSGNTLYAENGVKISLGGIAKGFFGDEIIKAFEKSGASAVFSLGGNVVTLGTKQGGAWRIAIKDPTNGSSSFCTVSVGENTSVVTSGGYERYFEFEGKTYHHILDPKTGYPATGDVLSVTVIGKDGALCDALSTGLFVLGAKKAAELIPDGFDYVILCTENRIYTSLSQDTLELFEPQKYEIIK